MSGFGGVCEELITKILEIRIDPCTVSLWVRNKALRPMVSRNPAECRDFASDDSGAQKSPFSRLAGRSDNDEDWKLI